jgi:hypothetical protein
MPGPEGLDGMDRANLGAIDLGGAGRAAARARMWSPLRRRRRVQRRSGHGGEPVGRLCIAVGITAEDAAGEEALSGETAKNVKSSSNCRMSPSVVRRG